MENKMVNEFLELKRAFLRRSFSKMNDNQMEAVFHINGPLMILAGAGSGKTTVIVNRIANMVRYGNAYNDTDISNNIDSSDMEYLNKAYCEGCSADDVIDKIKSKCVKPWNILAITFTNKAANELKERLTAMLGDEGKDIWASTFHSMCARILRMYGDRLGYTNHFAIYDMEDIKKLIKECQKQLKIDDKILSYRTISRKISRAKDDLLGPDDFQNEVKDNFTLDEIAKAYSLYQKRLKEADAMDFDDLIFNTIKLLQGCPDILEKLQNKFQYVLVDEYQDTNYAQYILVKLLSGKYRNLCVVGDDDQSIYKFRGATIENIIDFEKNYTDAKVIRLEQNYRSTKNILDAANAVIKNNEKRKGKTLWTQNPEGEKITSHTSCSEHDEASYMVDAIKEGISNGKSYSDFSVLYRNNSQSNVIEKVFVRSGIPYRIIGGVRFYERKEVRDMLAYLSVINNPMDEVRLRRIINQPRRSIGERTISQVCEIGAESNTGLLEVIRNSSRYDTLQRVSSKLQVFSNIMDNLISSYRKNGITLEELYKMILDTTGYMEFLKTDKDDAENRIANIKELGANIVKYEQEKGSEATLSGFLEEVSLLTDIDNYDKSSSSVVLMTMHSAKGLEFPVVFLPGFEEDIFPGRQVMENPEELEEERRLAYVGITRAKEKLYIVNCGSRMIFGSTMHNKSSRFISEIPGELVERTKSRDWKRLEPGEDTPRSAQDIRNKSAIAARHFGQVVGGSTSKGNTIFNPGDFVIHNVFGKGTIVSSVRMGNDNMLEISFENIGIKKLMSNFARLQKVN